MESGRSRIVKEVLPAKFSVQAGNARENRKTLAVFAVCNFGNFLRPIKSDQRVRDSQSFGTRVMSRKMGSQPQGHNSSMVIPLWILLLSVCALSFVCSSPLAHSREPISLEAEMAGPSTQQQDNAVNAFVEGKQLAAQGTAGSLRAAAEKFKQAAELFRAAGNRQAEGASLTMLASVETALSENQRAFEHLTQALPLLQAAGDRSGEANALANLVVASDNLGEKQKALENYKQALPVLREINDRQSEATVLSNIGKVLLDLGELEQALEYFNQALPLRRAAKDSAGEAATLVNLGNAYSALGDKIKALD